MIEVVAARAATAGSEHGAEGGAVGLGSGLAHSKKEGCVSWLLFPPAAALREVDIRPPGQRD